MKTQKFFGRYLVLITLLIIVIFSFSIINVRSIFLDEKQIDMANRANEISKEINNFVTLVNEHLTFISNFVNVNNANEMIT